jgi:hypothetical protein
MRRRAFDKRLFPEHRDIRRAFDMKTFARRQANIPV